jgi:hypothetical protein
MQDGRGQCDRRTLLWAEKSAAAGMDCRAWLSQAMREILVLQGFLPWHGAC